MIRRLRVASLTALLPVFLIPLASVATCFVLPKGESALELFVDGFRSHFPMSATVSGYLSRGGRSQSARGGAPAGKKAGGASYTAKGGVGKGTASSGGPASPNGKGTAQDPHAAGGPGGTVDKSGEGKGGAGMPNLGGRKGTNSNIDPGDPKMLQTLTKERKLFEDYEKETVELKSAPANQDAVVLKVGSATPTYIRRYTLDFFDGTIWKRVMPVPTMPLLPTPKLGFDLTASESVYVPPDLPTEEVTQEFRLEVPMGYVLPHTWMPQIVKIENSELRIDGDGTVKLLAPLGEKAHYSITSQVPVYDLEMMRRLPSETLFQLDEDREDERKIAEACLQLPPNLNPKIKTMGADAAGIEGNWFSKAERIAEYLKSHYHYNKRSFLESVPAQAKAPGSDSAAAGNPSASAGGPTDVWGGESTSTKIAADGTSSSASNDNAAGGASAAGKDNPAGKVNPAGKDNPAGKNDPAGKNNPAGKNVPAGKVTSGAGNSLANSSGADPSAATSELDHFLFESKVGNCRHFSSAFALLCRTQGIPSRIVTGFLPGEFNKRTGYREIRGRDSHVWVEVYIPYWNWVPFDPTPDGLLPAHQEGGNVLTKFIKSGLANPFGQSVSHRPSRKPEPAKGPGQDGDQPKPDTTKGGDSGIGLDSLKNKPKGSTFSLPWLGTVDQSQIQSVAKLIGVVLAFLAMVVVIIVYTKQRKAAEVKELLSNHPPSTLLFLEVLGELKRYEFVKLPTETADELSDRARSQFAQQVQGGRHVPQELPEVVSEFMELYTQERFGGADHLDELSELSQRIKTLSHSKAGR